MLIHHSAEDYNIAASIAATEARSKFEAEIKRGKTRAMAVIQQVQDQVPQDRIVSAKNIEFVTLGGIQVRYPDKNGTIEKLHRHAVGQAAQRGRIPLTFIDRLMNEKADWATQLVAENLNRVYQNGAADDARYLTRSVNGEVRGFLSDSYRRLDSRPILDAFIGQVAQYGAVPVEGYALDTKVAVKVVLPYVFEPIDHEVMIFGAAFETSDFGDGALSVRSFVERLWCTNRAITKEDLRKIHLGARLPENLQLSAETYRWDTLTMASAVKDITTGTLSPENVNRYMDTIKKANAEKIDGRKMQDFLKANLLKEEAAAVTEAFNSPEIEMLPAGQTAWRMSNAISWIANTKIEDESRKLDVMKVAGSVLDQVLDKQLVRQAA